MSWVLANTVSDFFGENPLHIVYGVALALGVIYAAFLMFFHGLGDALGDFDLGGHDLDLGGHHLDVHLGDHESAAEAVGVSMLAIASFVSSFGAFGLVAVTLFDAGTIGSLVVALLGGAVFGVAAQLFFLYIISPTVNSTVHQTELIGQVAETIVPIPTNGVGRIAFVAGGSRMTYSARASEQERAIARGVPVRIDRVVGGVAYVSELDR